jgi:hypothetical protein
MMRFIKAILDIRSPSLVIFDKEPIFERFNFWGFQFDMYTGRYDTAWGFELCRPKQDLFIDNEWRVLSIRFNPPSIKIRKDGNYFTHT